MAEEVTRYVAFLRAINVGGHTVKMERLRELFAELGLANVETFIASGNVIFDAPSGDAGALERQIEQHLHAARSSLRLFGGLQSPRNSIRIGSVECFEERVCVLILF